MSSEAPRQRLSMDDIIVMLEDIARNDTGPDKFRAIKALTAQKAQEAVLPDPMNEAEITSRLARLMTGAGIGLARLAYLKAFAHKTQAFRIKAQIAALNKEAADRANEPYPRTMSAFLKRYPMLKRKGGLPKGYLKCKSILAREEWLRRQTDLIEAERLQQAQQDAVTDIFEAEKNDFADIPGLEAKTPDPAPHPSSADPGVQGD
jgi:hypothetical protein